MTAARTALLTLAGILVLTCTLALVSRSAPVEPPLATDRAAAAAPGGCFVPNLGQWTHPSRFVHGSGPMTMFLQDRGWVLDLAHRTPAVAPAGDGSPPMPGGARKSIDTEPARTRGVALRMTFEGDPRVPALRGEDRLCGHHNYFLGADPARWRTDVPRFGAVLYEGLYHGIDLRVRQAQGAPEYDLLLAPGADLDDVVVRVEGAGGLSISPDGSLVAATPLGPLTQPRPRTWQVGADGSKHPVACDYVLLGPDRFGLVAPGWSGDTALTIDPPLIWSTFLGGTDQESKYMGMSVDDAGVVTIGGSTWSKDFPTSPGCYDNTGTGTKAVVTRLDPRRKPNEQLLFSTFLGGNKRTDGFDVTHGPGGLACVVGHTQASDFPTTKDAYDRAYWGGDGFITVFDPNQTGINQLVYSTFLGGSGTEAVEAVEIDDAGVITVAGFTMSLDFDTTPGCYSSRFMGTRDVFVSRLDPRKSGTSQLTFSTLLGGTGPERVWSALAVAPDGVVTISGETSSSNFPTTPTAFDGTLSGGIDAFVAQLDPRKTGSAQLVYSTYLGGWNIDNGYGVDVDSRGIVTVVGNTGSADLRIVGGFAPTLLGPWSGFVARIDPTASGSASLVYSTFLGGTGTDAAFAVVAEAGGAVTVTGGTSSSDFPTAGPAYDTTYNNGTVSWGDAFVTRLLPGAPASAQLAYSTYLGGADGEIGFAIAADETGTVTVGGTTGSAGFPVTRNAYDISHNGPNGGTGDFFVTRLSMGAKLYADGYELSVQQGGTQELTIDAGAQHAGKPYLLLGSMTGTLPGIRLNSSLVLPLNYDPYLDLTLFLPNSPLLSNNLGLLDANGSATVRFNVLPVIPPPPPGGFVLHHAYVVFGAGPAFDMVSKPVRLRLVR